MLKVCPECKGTGLDTADDLLSHLAETKEPAKCAYCDGKGMVS